MSRAEASRYREAYARWQADPEAFWAEAAPEIDWVRPAERMFDPAAGVYGRWFVGALCNTCHNAVDRHVARGPRRAGGDRYDSPVDGHASARITYAELKDEVATLGAVLAGPRRRRATASSSTCR